MGTGRGFTLRSSRAGGAADLVDAAGAGCDAVDEAGTWAALGVGTVPRSKVAATWADSQKNRFILPHP